MSARPATAPVPSGAVAEAETQAARVAMAWPAAHQWWSLVKDTAAAWVDDYAPSMGAALAYYTVFSLAPFLLIVISIAGLVFGADAVRGEIFGQLRGMMGDEGAQAIEHLLASVSEPSHGAIAALIGAVFLLVGATSVFGELQNALDRIWRAPAPDKFAGLWHLLLARALSLAIICGVAFLLMVSLVLGAMMVALGNWWGSYFQGWEILAHALNAFAAFALTTVLFAFIYKVLPRVNVRWRDVWIGAAVTSVLFTIGKTLISFYVGKTSIVSGFGAAGSLIVVFVWVYYSAQIFLFGAEFTSVYARTLGSMRSKSGGHSPDEARSAATG